MPRPLAQVREAYLQFMVSVATMLRADMNLPENSYLVQEDMAQVLKLETQLANVSLARGGSGGGPGPWHRPLSPLAPHPVQATAPQEERHDVTALYHRMEVEQLQSKFSLKVRLPPLPPRLPHRPVPPGQTPAPPAPVPAAPIRNAPDPEQAAM